MRISFCKVLNNVYLYASFFKFSLLCNNNSCQKILKAIKKQNILDTENTTILIDGDNNRSKAIVEQTAQNLIDIARKIKSASNKQ